jgi:hypothetical protein
VLMKMFAAAALSANAAPTLRHRFEASAADAKRLPIIGLNQQALFYEAFISRAVRFNMGSGPLGGEFSQPIRPYRCLSKEVPDLSEYCTLSRGELEVLLSRSHDPSITKSGGINGDDRALRVSRAAFDLHLVLAVPLS